MRNYLLAAAAAVAIASPAMARDGSAYVGVDLGGIIVEDIDIDVNTPTGLRTDVAIGNHNIGYDVGVNIGYDFGVLRAEAELAYKRASHDSYVLGTTTIPADGRTTSASVMGNLLLDFGDDDGWQGFVGGGVGVARSRVLLEAAGLTGRSLRDNGFAWQLLAGARYPISQNIDLGVKYRFFNHDVNDDVTFAPVAAVTGAADARVRSHSLLASLTFNLGSAPPPPPPVVEPAPPPPPPPAPATQTCPDGSVILATDACPVPPPPPPPPPPVPERG